MLSHSDLQTVEGISENRLGIVAGTRLHAQQI
jgi:hypothetical protein